MTGAEWHVHTAGSCTKTTLSRVHCTHGGHRAAVHPVCAAALHRLLGRRSCAVYAAAPQAVSRPSADPWDTGSDASVIARLPEQHRRHDGVSHTSIHQKPGKRAQRGPGLLAGSQETDNAAWPLDEPWDSYATMKVPVHIHSNSDTGSDEQPAAPPSPWLSATRLQDARHADEVAHTHVERHHELRAGAASSSDARPYRHATSQSVGKSQAAPASNKAMHSHVRQSAEVPEHSHKTTEQRRHQTQSNARPLVSDAQPARPSAGNVWAPAPSVAAHIDQRRPPSIHARQQGKPAHVTVDAVGSTVEDAWSASTTDAPLELVEADTSAPLQQRNPLSNKQSTGNGRSNVQHQPLAATAAATAVRSAANSSASGTVRSDTQPSAGHAPTHGIKQIHMPTEPAQSRASAGPSSASSAYTAQAAAEGTDAAQVMSQHYDRHAQEQASHAASDSRYAGAAHTDWPVDLPWSEYANQLATQSDESFDGGPADDASDSDSDEVEAPMADEYSEEPVDWLQSSASAVATARSRSARVPRQAAAQRVGSRDVAAGGAQLERDPRIQDAAAREAWLQGVRRQPGAFMLQVQQYTVPKVKHRFQRMGVAPPAYVYEYINTPVHRETVALTFPLQQRKVPKYIARREVHARLLKMRHRGLEHPEMPGPHLAIEVGAAFDRWAALARTCGAAVPAPWPAPAKAIFVRMHEVPEATLLARAAEAVDALVTLLRDAPQDCALALVLDMLTQALRRHVQFRDVALLEPAFKDAVSAALCTAAADPELYQIGSFLEGHAVAQLEFRIDCEPYWATLDAPNNDPVLRKGGRNPLDVFRPWELTPWFHTYALLVARSQRPAPSERLLRDINQIMEKYPRKVKAPELALRWHAYALLRMRPSQKASAILIEHTHLRDDWMNGHECAMVLWSMTALSVQHIRLALSMLRRVHQKAEDMAAHDVAVALWAMHHQKAMETKKHFWLEAFKLKCMSALREKAHRIASDGAAKALWALWKSGQRPDEELWSACMSAIEMEAQCLQEHSNRLRGPTAAHLLHSLALFADTPPPLPMRKHAAAAVDDCTGGLQGMDASVRDKEAEAAQEAEATERWQQTRDTNTFGGVLTADAHSVSHRESTGDVAESAQLQQLSSADDNSDSSASEGGSVKADIRSGGSSTHSDRRRSSNASDANAGAPSIAAMLRDTGSKPTIANDRFRNDRGSLAALKRGRNKPVMRKAEQVRRAIAGQPPSKRPWSPPETVKTDPVIAKIWRMYSRWDGEGADNAAELAAERRAQSRSIAEQRAAQKARQARDAEDAAAYAAAAAPGSANSAVHGNCGFVRGETGEIIPLGGGYVDASTAAAFRRRAALLRGLAAEVHAAYEVERLRRRPIWKFFKGKRFESELADAPDLDPLESSRIERDAARFEYAALNFTHSFAAPRHVRDALAAAIDSDHAALSVYEGAKAHQALQLLGCAGSVSQECAAALRAHAATVAGEATGAASDIADYQRERDAYFERRAEMSYEELRAERRDRWRRQREQQYAELNRRIRMRRESRAAKRARAVSRRNALARATMLEWRREREQARSAELQAPSFGVQLRINEGEKALFNAWKAPAADAPHSHGSRPAADPEATDAWRARKRATELRNDALLASVGWVTPVAVRSNGAAAQVLVHNGVAKPPLDDAKMDGHGECISEHKDVPDEQHHEQHKEQHDQMLATNCVTTVVTAPVRDADTAFAGAWRK